MIELQQALILLPFMKTRPVAGALLYHPAYGAVLVIGSGPADSVRVREVDCKRNHLVPAAMLHSTPVGPFRPSEEVKKIIRQIDAEAQADINRESRSAIQQPRPSRGGGSFERNRSRH